MDSTLLRSRSATLLLAASLLTSLVLGGLFVVVHRMYDVRGAEEASAAPLSDDQTRQQVLVPGRQFIGAGNLQAVNANYVLLSCSSEEQPPYQGALYLNFDVPTIAETPVFFRQIARAMTATGWREGLPPGRHPGGHTLAKDGVVAVYYRDPDRPGRGLLEIRGECRNVTDHSLDMTGFVDVTRDLSR